MMQQNVWIISHVSNIDLSAFKFFTLLFLVEYMLKWAHPYAFVVELNILMQI